MNRFLGSPGLESFPFQDGSRRCHPWQGQKVRQGGWLAPLVLPRKKMPALCSGHWLDGVFPCKGGGGGHYPLAPLSRGRPPLWHLNMPKLVTRPVCADKNSLACRGNPAKAQTYAVSGVGFPKEPTSRPARLRGACLWQRCPGADNAPELNRTANCCGPGVFTAPRSRRRWLPAESFPFCKQKGHS